MFLSLNWLKDFVNIPKSLTAEELGLKLTTHTVEIDSVTNEADKFKNIVVGKVLEIAKHPNADKLQVVKVDAGTGVEGGLKIVCGAHNFKVNDLVVVALPGAVMPNGMEIEKTELRGELSEGMLCAEDELGLGNDHSGIMILKKAKPGQKFSTYLGLNDVIYEVDNKSITHRPDLWGHYGMARDMAVFLNTKFSEMKKVDIENIAKDVKEKLKVQVEDAKLCPRYMAIKVSGIKIEESPKWLADRLVAVGSRPINNIVDITNYVMLELGQPMHAFDAKKTDEIIIRRAKNGETMKTLDGVERKLDSNMLVIADSKKPIAIAGVMGGENSEVSPETTEIIIESANFEPVCIRRTSQKLTLRTDAATRFEKSLDPNLCEQALVRFLELLRKICPDCIISSRLADVSEFKLNQGPIKLELDWLNRRIGQTLKPEDVISTLEKLGFEVAMPTRKSDHVILSVKIPTWRATKDVTIPEDLVEEVARIIGFDNIKLSMPKIDLRAPEINKEKQLIRRIKNILSAGASLAEVYNYVFTGEDQLQKLKLGTAGNIRLANPISSEFTLVRQSLAPSLIENIKTNQARYAEIGIFEIGAIAMDIPGDINKDISRASEKLPFQENRLGLALASSNKNIIKEAKGALEFLLGQLELEPVYEKMKNAPAWADKDLSAEIRVKRTSLGYLAKLDERVAQGAQVKKPVVIIEIRLRELLSLLAVQAEKKYEPLPKFPAVERDLAFVVESKMVYNDIKDEISGFNKLITSVELFDVYEGDKIGAGKRSLAFHLHYLDLEKTLTAQEVDLVQKSLIKRLEIKYGAVVRDF